MASLFTPNTGDEKLDEAYKRIQMYVESFDTFPKFEKYFNEIVQTDDMKRLNKWLLKVLFVQMKYTEHDFDKLIRLLSDENAEKIKQWLDSELKKVEGK